MTTENHVAEGQKSNPSSGMNYATLINVVLFIGLLVLAGLYFFKLNTTENQQAEQIQQDAKPHSENTQGIAYVHSEDLMNGYLLAGKMREEFETEQKRLENDLSRRQRNFQTEVEKFQNDISAGTIAMDRAQQREQELMQVQQDLMQLNETYRTRLAQKEIEMNNELFETISDFLQRYNAEKNFDYILSYSKGGNLLYAKQSNDITEEVLALINAEHTQKEIKK